MNLLVQVIEAVAYPAASALLLARACLPWLFDRRARIPTKKERP
ncbi:hypothetical protein JOF56_004176 [Kibdelosporangium banguiense]|uniref:Cellulose biosynthesis protein BcsF n=1 Tax=Kibdelosporangium banguiense TaxID=1365924 RepID=A0ABS4TH80_9PSEU|nr:hypothetical protein [Kibdelosporangium banguiense]MBP2323791.1 hypothetical protein [Kibdelosporangium banguiense]